MFLGFWNHRRIWDPIFGTQMNTDPTEPITDTKACLSDCNTQKEVGGWGLKGRHD